MYERFILVENTLRNMPGGYAMDLRLAYYRGISVTLVEGFEMIVDGDAVDGTRMELTVAGRTIPVAALADFSGIRWEFSEPATLRIACDGGLAPGGHDVHLTELLRIAYVPGTTRRTDRKTMQLCG